MVTLNEGRYPEEHLLWEPNRDYCREVITVLSGSGVIEPGTVLGKITASGKYKPATATGTDGAQVASVVSVYGCDATSADATVLASVRLTAVNGKQIVYGATINDDAKKAAANAQLAAVGIVVR